MRRLVAGISDRHVEIMRGELASILYQATRESTEYIFGDSIRTLLEEPDGIGPEPPGAAGSDAQLPRAGQAGCDVPGAPDRSREGRVPFRREQELSYDHRDVEAQKRLLREAFAGDGWKVPRLLAELDRAEDFYFDSISPIVMDTWSKGRVTLVGDAGYSPGPAVGGGTSVAMVGAYLLARELHDAGGDHQKAYSGYEARIREFVERSRTIGPTSMKTLVPRTPFQVWLTPRLTSLLPRLPIPLQRRLLALQGGPARALESVTLTAPEPTR